MNRKLLIEVIKFIIVGAINTLNYYIIYLTLLKIFKVPYLISHSVGFLISFFISFLLNCYFVYKVQPTWKKFLSFPLTQLINMGVQTFLLWLLVDIYQLSAIFAPIIGLVVTVPITFMLSKYVLKDR